MNIRARSWRIAFLWLAPATIALATPPQYVASRQIVLQYRATDDAPVEEVLLWVSTDAGRTWQAAEATRDGRHTVRYAAPADGRYDFYIVLRNAAGTSAAPPEPGSRPVATIVVDTLPPLLQLHGAEVQPTDDCGLQVSLRTTLVDENLSKAGLRLFYRDSSQRWIDAGPATALDDRLVGCLPRCDQPTVDVRVVAADLAGNSASADVLTVELPKPPNATPAPAATATQPICPAPAPPAELSPAAQRLCKLANTFLAEGKFSLAAARLEDALVLAPDNANLLTELGTTLYRAGRYDEASGRLQAALRSAPDHVGALDGLALVAVTQRQYSQAREYLQQLQRLRPNSGLVWLRSGDIEHRLGNSAPALAAWRKVLGVDDADQELRESARRRLDYFSPECGPQTRPSIGEPWPEQPQPRPSSFSTETTTTKKPAH